MPHREIQDTNTNPMALPWTTGSVTHNKKLLHGESAALWANASQMLLLLRKREELHYACIYLTIRIILNNIKALRAASVALVSLDRL